MMPGETHSAAPGTAADLARCQGCASLQQNLNEYVEALITLKQKIINTDNLLTEYQKKCDELQFARRENSTLHHQVEQMLQKISPLQKCQEELGSLKAELEEKKSSLKLYQDTHQEYARVKEACLKSDAQKKKLEAKVKKLEEAAVRQTQDFKQLRNEKKILEKEFKKTQERLDEFSKQKSGKELRHIGTQISSDSYGSIDRRKVKLLLKELWLCVNSAHRLPGEGNRCVTEKPAKDDTRSRASGEDDMLPPAQGSPPRPSDVQTCLAKLSTEVQAGFAALQSVDREQPDGVSRCASRVVFNEDRNPELLSWSPADWDRTDFAYRGNFLDKDLQAAMDFFKLPPPLLSPVPSPPRMSSPHLDSLPSSLTPETYFGEYTDSSDNDSTYPRNSSDSVSEDDVTDSRDYFGLSRKNKASGAWEEKPRLQETIPALNKLEVNKATAGGLVMFSEALREPSGTSAVAWEKLRMASSRLQSDRTKDVLGEVGRPEGVRERAESLQADRTCPTPGRSLWSESLCSSLGQEKDEATGQSLLCRRPQNELESESVSLPSRIIGSHTAEFTEWAHTDQITLEAECVTGSGPEQRLSREVEMDMEDMQGSTSEDSPEPEDDSDDTGGAMGPEGLSVRAGFSSISTSVPVSVCSNPQSSQLEHVSEADTPTKVISPELHHLEQKLQTQSLKTLLQAEPREHSVQESDPESNALSPISRAPTLNDQKIRETECTKVVEDLTKIYSFPQSVFRKVTKDGHCEIQDPRIELTLQKSDLTSLTDSQASLIKSSSGFVNSTSWQHSDLLRRSGESPRAASEHGQKGNHHFEVAAPTLQSRGSAAVPQVSGESSSPVEFKAATSLLPNQVSVITKQARPQKTQSAPSEHLSLSRKEPNVAVENRDDGSQETGSAAELGGEGKDTTGNIKEVATQKSNVLEASSSWRKDFDPLSGSLPAGHLDFSVDGKVPLSSEDMLPSNQKDSRDTALQDEAQAPNLSPPLLGLDPCRVEGLSAELAVTGDCPVEEALCRDTGTLSSEILACACSSTSTIQDTREPSKVTSGTPGAAFPERFVTTGITFSSPLCSKTEIQDLSQSSLLDSSLCCARIREAREDSEVEGSESLFSCSESELEADGVGRGSQGTVGDVPKALRDTEAGEPETGASLELVDLTSALQEFNLSPSPDIDTLSTTGVLMFLESCQLRDYSSGDSVCECSTKGTQRKDVDKKLKPSGLSGERCDKQPCEEETPASPTEWIKAEEENCSLKAPSPLAQCSLEVQSEVLARIGRELETSCEDCSGNNTGNALLLNMYSSLTVEDLKEKVPPQKVTSHGLELPLPASALDGRGSCPARSGSHAEHVENTPEDSPEATWLATHKKGPLEPAAPEVRTMQSTGCEANGAFRCQMHAAVSEVMNSLITEAQTEVMEEGYSWMDASSVTVSPDMEQVTLCKTPGDVTVSQGQGGLEAAFVSLAPLERSPETSFPGPALQEPLCGSVSGGSEDVSSSGQNSNFDKSRLRNRPVKPSIWIRSQIYDQTFETLNVTSDHTYYNSKLEPSGKNKSRPKIPSKDQPNKPAKALVPGRGETRQSEVAQPGSGDKSTTKTPRGQLQPILAKADTSTPTDCPLDTLSKIRQEVGPPLPPLLAPLVATPPRTSQPLSPLLSLPSPSPPSSPADLMSPSCEVAAPPVLSPWPEDPGLASPPGPSPSPSTATAGAAGRIVTSPLQFCAATPKHALPVPGRLPPCAPAHTTAVGGPQENSVKILDTMYPELSARARTLNLLKGNLQLSRSSSADGKTLPGPVSALIGLKAITSSKTAFVKTGGNSGGDSNQDRARDLRTQQDLGVKRTLSASTLRSAKRLRLDSESPEPEITGTAARLSPKKTPGNSTQPEVEPTEQEGSAATATCPVSQIAVSPKETVESHDKAIAHALKKIAESSFDLLPVIRSHVYVGNISKKPVMRDQEKEVVYEFSTTKKHLAECLLRSILSELKTQKVSVEHNYTHALCRVYVGICRQLGDLARARLFCYSLLKEDFPESEKLTLFIANMWHDVFGSQSVISKAMQLVARQRAKGEVLSCLKAFLSWEKNFSPVRNSEKT
ncbi:little elongation complex subunit 1 isoform X2 [Octodon degus]|uniref:Little elongation complex subunit 1 isoform X2 n=1 Tax=Octodon degus TaxID=10160 RepID=A0A6P6DQE7_OCTDE|nr:little elongation complex subunit 1 isoform X2 [Octodon degus]